MEVARLNLALPSDLGETLARLSAETGQSKSVIVSGAVRTMDTIRRHGKGKALALVDRLEPGDILVVPAL